MVENWGELYKKVKNMKPFLKVLLKEKCIERGSEILIPDEPLDIEIGAKDVKFYLYGELAGVLDENGLTVLIEGARDEIENWCIALSSPGFRRYLIKKRSSK